MSEWIIPARQRRPQQLPMQFVTMHSYECLSACNRWAEGRGRASKGVRPRGRGSSAVVSPCLHDRISNMETNNGWLKVRRQH